MEIRRQEIHESFNIKPGRMFEVLATPKAVRSWWGASKVVIEPREGGTWVAAAGDEDYDSEFINLFEILEFEPPTRMVLGRGQYFAGKNWPIRTSMTTEFIVEPQPAGCVLRIIQQLDPHDPLLDEFFDACIAGWQNSFDNIRSYLHNNPVA